MLPSLTALGRVFLRVQNPLELVRAQNRVPRHGSRPASRRSWSSTIWLEQGYQQADVQSQGLENEKGCRRQRQEVSSQESLSQNQGLD